MALVESFSLSTSQLINDKEVIQALEFFGWQTTPNYRAESISFPNSSNQCELRMVQKAGYISAGVFSAIQANNEQFEERAFSFFPDAKSTIISWIEKYGNFNLFEMTNNPNMLNF